MNLKSELLLMIFNSMIPELKPIYPDWISTSCQFTIWVTPVVVSRLLCLTTALKSHTPTSAIITSEGFLFKSRFLNSEIIVTNFFSF